MLAGMFPDFPSFRARPPWWGADLQTLRNFLARPAAGLHRYAGERLILPLRDGSGDALYAGGFFSSAGGQPTSFIAQWSGDSWSALGSGVDNAVWSLTSHDAGSGRCPRPGASRHDSPILEGCPTTSSLMSCRAAPVCCLP